MLKKQLESTQEEWQKIDRKLTNLKEYERSITDNLKLYSYKFKIKTTEKEIEKLKDELEELEQDIQAGDKENRALNNNDTSRRSSSMSYDERMQWLKHRHSKVISEKAGLLGEVRQLEDQIKRYTRELNSDFNNIEKLHREQIIVYKVKLCVMSNYLLSY